MSDSDQPVLPDGPSIPEMREAILSADELSALAEDLQRFTRILSVLRNRAARVHADQESVPLQDALNDLRAGAVSAVQVRYHYDDHEWTDTLLRSPQGIRLVRCQHVDPAAE